MHCLGDIITDGVNSRKGDLNLRVWDFRPGGTAEAAGSGSIPDGCSGFLARLRADLEGNVRGGGVAFAIKDEKVGAIEAGLLGGGDRRFELICINDAW